MTAVWARTRRISLVRRMGNGWAGQAGLTAGLVGVPEGVETVELWLGLASLVLVGEHLETDDAELGEVLVEDGDPIALGDLSGCRGRRDDRSRRLGLVGRLLEQLARVGDLGLELELELRD